MSPCSLKRPYGEGESVDREASPMEYRAGVARRVDIATPKEYRPPPPICVPRMPSPYLLAISD